MAKIQYDRYKITDKTGATPTTIAKTCAVLDVESTAGGVLLPRMTTAQRDVIPSVLAGLIIYNTTTNTLNYYNGTNWVSI